MEIDQYVAVPVPPTLRLGPADAGYLSVIKGKEAAAERSPLLSADRKRFLVERFSYWDNIVGRGQGMGVFQVDDWE